ncbi:MAG: MopE-related protein [Sandaracinaceae bacterium]
MCVRIPLLLLSVLALGCGTRSGLSVPESRDGATPPRDAGPDANRDGGPFDAGVDAAVCGGDCDDGLFCNGVERCDPAIASCVPGDPPDCDDDEECTRDSCDPGGNACVHIREERDEDRDGVGACEGDCDDTEPRARPGNEEVCDFIDNDCDRGVDEGVLSPCDDCRPGCNRVPIPGDDGWDLDANDNAGVEVDGDELTLSSSRTETHFAWIANHLFGTITKLDTRTGQQAAEYDAAFIDGTNGARPPGERCRTQSAGGNCPSRTAVDLRGAVYVANRAFFNQGTITKIAGLESDCVDRNGNGEIETSRDLDGDGRIERDVPGEFLGQQDECLLWTVDVGEAGEVPRAVAVDSGGRIWVGLHEASSVVQLDPNDGSVIRTVPLPRTSPFSGFRPYGAAADGRGNVWFVESASGSIIRVDADTGAVGSIRTAFTRDDDCSSSYGLAIDSDDRVWVAGFLCDAAFRFDQDTNRWFEVPLPDSGVSRGIAADGSGRIYVASSHEWIRFLADGTIVASDPISRLTAFDADTGRALRVYGTEDAPLPGLASTGVGLDSDGQVWLINQDSSSATRIDPATGVARDFPTGESPYTYSDFTGFALRTFTAPNGYFRTVVRGCGVGPTEWERLDWTASAPAGTRIEVRVRTAETVAELAAATWVGPWTDRPTDFALSPGPVGNDTVMELEVSLFSDGARAPAVEDVTVQFNCPI